jgi:hypothetical protein
MQTGSYTLNDLLNFTEISEPEYDIYDFSTNQSSRFEVIMINHLYLLVASREDKAVGGVTSGCRS